MKQARRHIFQPTFPPTPKHTCRGGSHAYKDGERQRGRKNNTSKLFPLNCPSCSSLPVGIWPETSPTADRRNRSPGSTEKSVSMFSNVAVRSQSGTVSPPPQPRKVFFFLLLFSPPLLRPLLPRLQVSSDSLFSALFLLLSVVQPLHALLSPGFCLFRFQRALSRTPHFVSRGGSEGARGRESERERQRQGEGARAQRGECVTSRGGSWLNKK